MTTARIIAILACVAISYNSYAYGCGGGVGAGVGGGAGHVGEVVGHVGGVGNHFGQIAGGLGHVAGHVPIGKCIYEEAEVRMANGAKKQVKHLDIGDEVLAYSMEKGVHPSRIFGELHNDNETLIKIIEIQTSSGRKIPVTPAHSLFVRQCLSDGESWSTKAAYEVSVGDCLPRYYTDGDVVEESVTHIRVFDARGIRQPVTETGTIIVDDVVISCYDRVVNQDATHMALFPYRWLMALTKAYAAQFKSLVPTFYNLITFDTSLF